MEADNGGLRYNAGKPKVSLIPPEAIDALATHFTRGAEKYAPRNWERGMDWSICFDSMQRHAWAWLGGEDYDQENGAHHMTAAAWNALALLVYHERNIGVDDRAQGGKRQSEAPTASEEPYQEGPLDTEVSRAKLAGQKA